MVIKETGDERTFDEKCIVITSIVVFVITALTALTYEFVLVRYSFLLIVIILSVIFRKKLISTFKTITKKEN